VPQRQAGGESLRGRRGAVRGRDWLVDVHEFVPGERLPGCRPYHASVGADPVGGEGAGRPLGFRRSRRLALERVAERILETGWISPEEAWRRTGECRSLIVKETVIEEEERLRRDGGCLAFGGAFAFGIRAIK